MLDLNLGSGFIPGRIGRDLLSGAVEIIDALSAAEVEWLAARHFSPRALQQRRLAERDEALRVAMRLSGESRPTPAAQMVARDLRRYLATAWRSNCALAELTGCSAYRAALHRLARANKGQPISARQVFDIGAGRRG
jgi:hypothetical protein